MSRLLRVLALLALLVAACGPAQRATTGYGSWWPPVQLRAGVDFIGTASVDTRRLVVVVDSSTGRVTRTLPLRAPQGLHLDSAVRLGTSAVLVTWTTGPACTSNVAGCGPRPGTCGGDVDRVDLGTGRVTRVWAVGRDTLLRSVRPSPDGTELAGLTSPCVPSYFNDSIAVRRLDGTRTWSVGARLPRCHSLSAPAWAPGGTLVVAYAASTATPSEAAGMADGTCTSFGPTSLVEVDAHRTQPGLAPLRQRPFRSGCSYQSPAGDGRVVYSLEACGPQGRLGGPFFLVRLDQQLKPTAHWRLGACTNGNSAAAAPHGAVLVAAYTYCQGKLSPGVAPSQPTHGLWALDPAGRLRHLTSKTSDARLLTLDAVG